MKKKNMGLYEFTLLLQAQKVSKSCQNNDQKLFVAAKPLKFIHFRNLRRIIINRSVTYGKVSKLLTREPLYRKLPSRDCSKIGHQRNERFRFLYFLNLCQCIFHLRYETFLYLSISFCSCSRRECLVITRVYFKKTSFFSSKNLLFRIMNDASFVQKEELKRICLKIYNLIDYYENPFRTR